MQEGRIALSTPNSSSLDRTMQTPATANSSGVAIPDRGLLEQPSLLLRPADRDGWRDIEAGSGEVAGFALWQESGPWRGWPWSWLAVHEEEESPLVFTVRRRLAVLPRREVRDAEGDLVGVLAGKWILDRWERPALAMRVGEGGEGEIVDLSSQVLATWSRHGQDVRLVFALGVQHDPFAKMLLLAAVLLR